MKHATYIGGPWCNLEELRNDAPAFIDKPSSPEGTARYVKFSADGTYAGLFALPSSTHVTYVSEGLPRDALCALSRTLGVPLFTEMGGPGDVRQPGP